MSIIINDVTYVHPDGETLFANASFSLGDAQKASLTGDNGSGKSTLLKLISGELKPLTGEISVSEKPYSVPQHFGQYDEMTVAQALGIADKIDALNAITAGDISEDNYTTLDDDWAIEERSAAALDFWGLDYILPGMSMSSLSGGEKTKVFLAGIKVHNPGIILMDEPTNHLDRDSRERLFSLLGEQAATVLIVSHDRELLNLLDTTLELTRKGIKRYGGNYDLYKALRDEHIEALEEQVGEREKAVRMARKASRETMERKQKMDARGENKQKKSGVPRIMMNTLRDGAEKSTARLKDKHTGKIDKAQKEIRELRGELPPLRNLKISMDDSPLHRGKVLIRATDINFGYDHAKPLWREPLSFIILSGDRIAVKGSNGAGKTTLLKVIPGLLEPTAGIIERAEFSYVYIDQEYSLVDNGLTVTQQLEKYNTRNLPVHELKTELHRFLFPADTWEKECVALSGGEKMRLMLCCLLVSDNAPDMFILDEPTNNLDISSMEILAATLAGYNGTVLAISHDLHFTKDIGIDGIIDLGIRAI